MPKFAVEIADNANRSIIFQPTQERLRGRWDRNNCSGKSTHQFLQKMPAVIPGICLLVNTDDKTCMTLDPLSLPQNEDLLGRINSAYKSHPDVVNDDAKGAWNTVITEECTDDMMKTWIYWMRRLIDGGHGIQCEFGDVPPKVKSIQAFPGNIFIGQFNSMKTRDFVLGESNQPANQAADAFGDS